MHYELSNIAEHEHRKASEKYREVRYDFEDGSTWEGWIPVYYRRTGLFLEFDDDIQEYLLSIGRHLHKEARAKWILDQKAFWSAEKGGANVTWPVFEKLLCLDWCCTNHSFGANTNIARRYQDIKELGYTLASDKSRRCQRCGEVRLHILLVPIPRGAATGYEVWSPELQKRIIRLLESYDAYEAKKTAPHGLLPDHKFPEIRWDAETKRETLGALNDEQIRADFQLLNNQRNQQKREVCRNCFQTKERGYPFGIKYYYCGEGNWPIGVPSVGKKAEKGCEGCGWYDFGKWRNSLIRLIIKR